MVVQVFFGNNVSFSYKVNYLEQKKGIQCLIDIIVVEQIVFIVIYYKIKLKLNLVEKVKKL